MGVWPLSWIVIVIVKELKMCLQNLDVYLINQGIFTLYVHTCTHTHNTHTHTHTRTRTHTHTHTHLPVTPRGVWRHAQVEDSANSAWVTLKDLLVSVYYWFKLHTGNLHSKTVLILILKHLSVLYSNAWAQWHTWDFGKGGSGYCNSMRSHIMPSWTVEHCSFGQAKYSGGLMQRLWRSGLP